MTWDSERYRKSWPLPRFTVTAPRLLAQIAAAQKLSMPGVEMELIAVYDERGNILLWDRFANGIWLGSRRTLRQAINP